MKIIVVDDQQEELRNFLNAARGITHFHQIEIFQNPWEALAYVREEMVDLAFLDIHLAQMNGLTLGQKMKQFCPSMLVVYVSGYEEALLSALKIKADYYIMKPYTGEELQRIVEKIDLLKNRERSRVFFRMFGRFDLFIDGKTVYISNAKAKELLALCMDHRGGNVTMEEAVDKLWENRVYDEKVKNLYRKAVSFLHRLFQQYQLAEIFVSHRGMCHIDIQQVECDYFTYLEETERGKETKKIPGPYLPEYSWAEETTAALENNAEI